MRFSVRDKFHFTLSCMILHLVSSMFFQFIANPSDTWNCENGTSIQYNTNQTFPNKILPILDHSVSFLGAVIISLLILTIYIRFKIVKSTPLSSLLLINVCLAHLLICANSILLFLSSKAPLDLPANATHFNGTNVYTFVADGMEHTYRIVRVCSFMMIYIVRLLHETRPCWLLLNRRRLLSLEKSFCLSVWVVGFAVGAFWIFMGIKIISLQESESGAKYMMASLSINVFIEICNFAGMIVSLASVLYLARFLFKNRPTRKNPDYNPSSDKYSIYHSIKSCLQILTLLFLLDLIFDVDLALHFVIFVLRYFSPPDCDPEVWLKMFNYLGTPTNYMYAYHCPYVLHAICTSLVFLLQKSLRLELRLVWRAVCWSVGRILKSRRDRSSSTVDF